MRVARTRRLISDLFLVVLALLPLLYVAGVGRGDDDPDCQEQVKEVHCTSGDPPTAACDEYKYAPEDPGSCKDKTWTITFPGMFVCTKDGSGKNKCVPVTEGTMSKTADCSKTFKCIVNLDDQCEKASQIGNTKKAGLYETKECPNSSEFP